MDLWWLSFCDDEKPAGEQFLGVCIVQANDFVEAVELSHLVGANPGGQVAGVPIPVGSVHPDDCVRLLTKEEARRIQGAYDDAHDAN